MLYLIRHAEALDAANDDIRPLSPRGREQVRQLADFLRGKGLFAPTALWHSPLVRARETATLLAQHLKFSVPLVETRGLRPEDSPVEIASILREQVEPIAVVGHEPHLSALASLLVSGRMAPPRFLFRKGCVLALDGAENHWSASWQISPDLLG
jgi:phosphohistidine phosphatase